MIEIVVPNKQANATVQLLKDQTLLECRRVRLSDEETMVRILLSVEMCEKALEVLSKQHPGKHSHVVVFPVQAILPVEDIKEKAESEKKQAEEKPPERIGREELYESIKDSARCTYVYLLMIALSTIVATIGLMRNNVAIIIGAMVIAPMLGPNMALALATTLGDAGLLLRAFLTSLAGYGLAIGMSVCFGFILFEIPSLQAIRSHTVVGFGDMVIALASGSAAALALASGASAILIGVMVAVSLLPPLVSFGLLLGTGHLHLAFGALSLFLINLVCINLAAVMTFIFQGIHPASWYEKGKAKKSIAIAIVLWVLLLLTWMGFLFWKGPFVF
ncbi:MAG: TIGR00341 family protein [Verrucomicrobia bacterium]|nr:TIGR00341 family protein [Verrucomicrobiota bacterium]